MPDPQAGRRTVTPFVTLNVEGLPETKGSWRAMSRGRVKADNPREKAWSTHVAWVARLMMRGKLPIAGGALVTLDFSLPEPKGKMNRRDLDKLVRSCLDAMNRIVYVDDELVRDLVAHKEVTAGVGGVEINVFPSFGVRARDLVRFWIDQHDAMRRVECPS